MQDNLIFLSGPHGSGKSTLVKKLAEEDPNILIPELYSKNIKFHTDPVYRQILKICERAIENYEYLKIAKENSDKIILGNRCIYDVLAYNWVYYAKDWISKETCEMYNKHTLDFFRNENAEPYAIILNPPFETLVEHLCKRWEEKEKKWQEDDMDYLKAACQAYEMFQDNEKILYIDREINLEDRLEIEEIKDWIKTRKIKDVLVYV